MIKVKDNFYELEELHALILEHDPSRRDMANFFEIHETSISRLFPKIFPDIQLEKNCCRSLKRILLEAETLFWVYTLRKFL